MDWIDMAKDRDMCMAHGCCEHGNEPSVSVKCRERLWLVEVFILPKRTVLHEVNFGGENKESVSQGKSYPCRDAIRVFVQERGNNLH
jgi:hypothetical protein